MTQMKYYGPDSAIALRVGDQTGDGLELLLRDGAVIDAPADADAVLTLVALGHLVPVVQTTSGAPAALVASSVDTADSASKTSKTKGA